MAQALALWKGRPFQCVSVSQYLAAAAAQLEEEHYNVFEHWVEAELLLGRNSAVIGRLQAWLAQAPLRERMYGQLMLALYRSGRQTDTLQAFQDLRHHLTNDLGIEPSLPVQRLHQQMLAGDPELFDPVLTDPSQPSHTVTRGRGRDLLEARLMVFSRTRAARGDKAALDAIVVGTGPNGLAAALILARAGLEVAVYEAAPTIGGGTRTAELTLPGFVHDVCSSVHPMALSSPFFRAFDLAAHGVRMLQPEVAYAHPLDGGRAGLAWRDLEATVEGLGRDGDAWRSLMRPLVRRWEDVTTLTMSDLRRVPPLRAMAGFGTRMLEQISPLWRVRFREDVAPAMLSGVGAHAIVPPSSPAAAGVGLLLATLAHAVGWPVPQGGSRAISEAMAAEIRRLGGRFVTGRHIHDLAELPPARTLILNMSPRGLLRLAGEDLPPLYSRRLRDFRYGGGVCKVDFALSGSVPWSASGCERAGTLHLVGSRQEAQAVERDIRVGRHAERPYVLAVQAGVADAGRAPAGHQALSAYAHVPQGSPVDVSEAVIRQIERFAPGFRDLILATHVVTARDQEANNPNYVGGDIAAGAMTVRQTVARPAPRWDPYATPIPGVYLCSASTPPGPGVHGMAGLHAARRVLRREFGIRKDPLALVRGDSCVSAESWPW